MSHRSRTFLFRKIEIDGVQTFTDTATNLEDKGTEENLRSVTTTNATLVQEV